MLGILIICAMVQVKECPTNQTNVAVFDFSGAGVEKELVTTISDLLRLELSNCPKYKIMDKDSMIKVLGTDIVVTGVDKAIGYCESLGISYAVIGQLTKLGEKIIISVSLVNRWTKRELFKDTQKSASIEDLDMVIKRIAEGLCELKKSKGKVTVESVTEEEAKPRRRRESYHSGGLLVGSLWAMGDYFGKEVIGETFMNMGTDLKLGDNIRMMQGGALSYFYETPYYIAEVNYRLHKKSLSSYMGASFGGYRFLTLTDFAPYLGGGLGMSWCSKAVGIDSLYPDYINANGDTVWQCKVKKESFDGMLVELGGGLALFRTYDFHFLVNLKYWMLMAKNYPNGMIISFGITYRKSGSGCGI
ncbi:MAG: hypothetical protein HY769_07980 [Candidatus Stahlbacteria bacterium]|nr:hypothetical protein [Candidatus Stahlbacteria bacterium]